jgi:hypothetical protein
MGLRRTKFRAAASSISIAAVPSAAAILLIHKVPIATAAAGDRSEIQAGADRQRAGPGAKIIDGRAGQNPSHFAFLQDAMLPRPRWRSPIRDDACCQGRDWLW